MSDPIRILHVFGALNRGGAETMVMNLYRNFDRNKVQFDFVIHCPGPCDYSREIEAFGGKVYSVPRFNGKNYFQYVKAWDCFFQEHAEYKIIHGHVRSTAAIYLRIAKRFGLITIAHSHSTSNGAGLPGLIKNMMQYPVRYSSDHLFACSQKAGEWMYGRKAVKKDSFQIIQNAIDISKYSYNPVVRKAKRAELNLNDQFVIGHVGRFEYPKNHLFLIDAFKEIHDQNSAAVLLLIGDGELRPEIEKKILQLNLRNFVILTGVRSDVPELMQAMDVFILPSLYEGLGIAAIEAQAAGLRCLVSDAIPREAFITDLIEALPLSAHPKEWADQLLRFKNGYERKNTFTQIQNAGYDVRDSAKKLEEFYLKCYDT